MNEKKFKIIVDESDLIVISHKVDGQVHREYIVIDRRTGILYLEENLFEMVKRIYELREIEELTDLNPRSDENRAYVMGGDF